MKVAVDSRGNAGTMPSASKKVSELEDILKHKTFTRSEIDHLTALLLSKNIENSDVTAEGGSARKLSTLQAVLTGQVKLSDHSAHENRIQHLRSAVISSPELRYNVVPEDAASPAEIAKAYMGRRPTNVSPSVLHLRNQLPKEDLSSSSCPLSKSPPVTSLSQKPFRVIGTSSSGLVTPRFRGRSAIYRMARTPYSRHQPVTTFKAAETNFNTGRGSSNPNTTENDPTRKQVLKRRSSVLENDIGSIGPIRRIRQKANLLHPTTVSLPPPRCHQTEHVSGVVSDVAEVSEQNSQNGSFSKLVARDNLPDTTSQFVPSQSIEMAQKIFDQLDKFSPKANLGKKVDVSIGISPAKTPDMENLNSLKVLQSSQDTKKFIRSFASVNAPSHLPQTPLMVEELSAKYFKTSSAIIGQDDAEDEKGGQCLSNTGKAAEYMMPAVDCPTKQAFRMSAQEDFLELDEDLPSYNPFAEGTQNTESPRLSDTTPDTFQRDVPLAMENTPVTKITMPLGKHELESFANGSSASEKTVSMPSLVSLSSPATNLIPPVGVNPLQPTPKSNKIARQNQNTDTLTASSSKAGNLLPITPSPTPKDAKLESAVSANKAAAEVNGPDKSDHKSAPVFALFGNSAIKSGQAPTVGAWCNGTHISDSTPVGVLSQSPAEAPFPSSSSNNQTSVSISTTSPFPSAGLKFSNGVVQSTFTPSASTPGISSTNHPSSSVPAPSISFAFGFPSASTSLLTSASHIDARSDAPSIGNASSSPLDTKPVDFSFQANNTPVSAFTPSVFAQSATSASAPVSMPVPSFSSQSASSVSAPVSLSTPSFPVQSASSALAPTSTLDLSFPAHSATPPPAFIFGSSGTTGSSTGSIFGSFSGLGTASSAMGASSSISSSSSTTTAIFGFTSQTHKSTTTFALGSSAAATSSMSVGAPTSSLSFGASTSSSPFGNTTGGVFGATTNSSTASNTTPFFLGGASCVAASTPAVTNSPFPSNISKQPFGFGLTSPANNGQMTMEDTMAEDSLQPPTPPLAFGATHAFGAQPAFGAPIPAPSVGGFSFNASPAAGSPYQFSTQPNQTAPQNPPFQPSGSLEFNNGGTGTNSFSLGTNDKSQRRIVRVKKTGRRK